MIRLNFVSFVRATNWCRCGRIYFLGSNTEPRTRRNACGTWWRQPWMCRFRLCWRLPSMKWILQPCIWLCCRLLTLWKTIQEPIQSVSIDFFNLIGILTQASSNLTGSRSLIWERFWDGRRSLQRLITNFEPPLLSYYYAFWVEFGRRCVQCGWIWSPSSFCCYRGWWARCPLCSHWFVPGDGRRIPNPRWSIGRPHYVPWSRDLHLWVAYVQKSIVWTPGLLIWGIDVLALRCR